MPAPPDGDRSSCPRPRGRARPGRRLPPLELAALVAVLVAVAMVALAGGLDGLSIDSSPVVVPIGVGAAVGLTVGVARRSRRWWTRTLPVTVVAIAATEAALGWYLKASGTIVDQFPPTFYLWVGLALLAPATVASGWRGAGRAHHSVGLAAVPMAIAAAFLMINSHYGYWPTLGDLLGHPMTGQVSAGTLNRELRGAASPGARRPTRLNWDDPRDERGRQQAAADRDRALRPAVPALDGSALAHLVARPTVASSAPAAGRAATTGSSPQPAATQVAPLPTTGQFAAVQIPATVSHFVHRWDYVYLPPAYFSAQRDRLGVLVMLAGTPSSPDIWATGGSAVATANAYARTHHGVAPVMLFVDANGAWAGDTECVDGPRGRAETYLTQDVVHFAVDTLHLTADPDRWGIVGFSEGGTCAYDLALRHPTLFHHFVDLAGDAAPNVTGSIVHQLYGGSSRAMRQHQPAWLLRHPVGSYADLTAWFGVGVGDTQHLRLSAHQAAAARRAGVRTTWFVGPDAHDWQFCSWALRRVLPGLAAEVDPRSPAVPAPTRHTRPGPAQAARHRVAPAARHPSATPATTIDPATRA